MELQVIFRRTSSKEFPRALEVARAQSGFSADEDAGQYAVTFNQDQLDGYQELVGLVGRWAQTRILLNGGEVARERLTHMLECYRARLAAPDRRVYCAGGVVHQSRVGAVRQLFPCRMIPISEGNTHSWFQYGRLTRDGVFVVDKGQLRQAVATTLKDTLAEHCPALFPAEVDAVVDRLPDRIDPRKDPNWVYRDGWHNGRFVPVGVEKRSGAQGTRARPASTREPEADAEGVEAPALPPTQIAPIRYRDIGGLGPQIRVVRENLELPLRFPALFAHLGVEPHRGLLLSGPPGTGKTMLARALATEAQATFLAINGPEILSKWRGESEGNLRRVFSEARDNAPAVVLIDEVDAIAPDRSRVQHNHEAVLVSQILTLLDGLADRGQVVVVATTNRPDLVDPAVRRPGRLDLLVEIGLPDRTARRDILRIHSARMPLAGDVDLEELAGETQGFAGAHLGALCREAGMECMREVVRLDPQDGFMLAEEDLPKLVVSALHFRAALRVIGRSLATPSS